MNPILIINILVEDDNYDINASPDKREVFLKNEKEVIDLMKVHLADFYENIQIAGVCVADTYLYPSATLLII